MKRSTLYAVAVVALVLAFVPDPTDLLDAGLPFIELAVSVVAAVSASKVKK